ncbi:hypothetical protein OF83DRAFT_1083836 [Amylostereum chailletii]|nr:hypothetical protein OF83DRAFT_1083836 [Amylostereum chailletii]
MFVFCGSLRITGSPSRFLAIGRLLGAFFIAPSLFVHLFNDLTSRVSQYSTQIDHIVYNVDSMELSTASYDEQQATMIERFRRNAIVNYAQGYQREIQLNKLLVDLTHNQLTLLKHYPDSHDLCCLAAPAYTDQVAICDDLRSRLETLQALTNKGTTNDGDLALARKASLEMLHARLKYYAKELQTSACNVEAQGSSLQEHPTIGNIKGKIKLLAEREAHLRAELSSLRKSQQALEQEHRMCLPTLSSGQGKAVYPDASVRGWLESRIKRIEEETKSLTIQIPSRLENRNADLTTASSLQKLVDAYPRCVLRSVQTEIKQALTEMSDLLTTYLSFYDSGVGIDNPTRLREVQDLHTRTSALLLGINKSSNRADKLEPWLLQVQHATMVAEGSVEKTRGIISSVSKEICEVKSKRDASVDAISSLKRRLEILEQDHLVERTRHVSLVDSLKALETRHDPMGQLETLSTKAKAMNTMQCLAVEDRKKEEVILSQLHAELVRVKGNIKSTRDELAQRPLTVEQAEDEKLLNGAKVRPLASSCTLIISTRIHRRFSCASGAVLGIGTGLSLVVTTFAKSA